jgi:hypothetical protein
MPATPPPMTVTVFCEFCCEGFNLSSNDRLKQTAATHARKADEQNAELFGQGHAGAVREHIVVGALDALEQAVIDRNQHPQGGAALAVDQGQ